MGLKVIIVILILLILVGGTILLEKIRNYYISKTIKRVSKESINKSVAEGKITKRQGEALIWLLFEYKPIKK